jgi:2-amino-4-hydroxy-6-hydroxymethyldihydropteridine diphosphokinase
MVGAYLGLGSNQGDSWQYLQNAVDALQAQVAIQVQKISPVYQSKPYGPQDQPDYLNAVVEIKTSLSAEHLLSVLWEIEASNERTRTGRRWTARTLDLDILLYDQLTLQTERLTIPHPEMCKRSFVVYPLYDIAGNLQIPQASGVLYLADCMRQCPVDDLQKMQDTLTREN